MSDQTNPTMPAMRMLLTVAAILVLIIGVPLYFVPTSTPLLFSWTVNPPITAAFLGSGYLAAFVIEMTSARETSWTRARIAVPAVLTFTTMTLIATLLHFDKFHFGPQFPQLTQFVTYVWLVVYAAVPVVMAVLLALQIKRVRADTRRPAPMPGWSCALFAALGVILLMMGVALFFFPLETKGIAWPWPLSALTARAIGAWCLGNGLLFVQIAIERDFWRVENALSALFVYGILLLGSLIRLSRDVAANGDPVLNLADPTLWAYVAFVLVMLFATGHGWRQARRLS
jgi:hypothetical protein